MQPLFRLPKKDKTALANQQEQLRQSSVYKRMTIRELVSVYAPWVWKDEAELNLFLIRCRGILGGRAIANGSATEVEFIEGERLVLTDSQNGRKLVFFFSKGDAILNEHEIVVVKNKK